ncbi:MAG: anthranilate phosphoribosyltransferase [Bacteroidetes bacterium]|nr:anthranilate phosphoribosyltransferase [Bacteroidota bacterium]
MKEILHQLINQQPLNRRQAREVLTDLATGKYQPSQVSAFITVYLMRPISLDELQGFREAMLDLCRPVQVDRPTIDVCGTGGDGKNTFNISTLSAFVVAAAGQPVAKHGNYGVSSVSGSSNVMEYLGFTFPTTADQLNRCLDKTGILFMHAPLFHPAMKNVAPIRKELGVKTFFNMLGPMVNPASPTYQLTGVFNLELARLYGYLYQGLDKQFMILHDLNGYDEISLTGSVKVYTNAGEQLLSPEDFGLQPVDYDHIAGGISVEDSAKIFLDVLKGEGTSQQTDVVAANSSAALVTAGKCKDFAEGTLLAKEILNSGKAYRGFKDLIEISKAF